ncbi:MAG TPA: oligosaccharide flippase family protein [Steroidobacteraceae bacterium]|nr:oligosaccharide flippase family protein [Steroidobacteraceae bacterium]
MSRARNALWLTGGRLTGDVLNLLLFVLISREFGPAGVGGYSYGFAVATFGYVIGCLGVEEYGLRQYARLDGPARAAFLGGLLGTQLLMQAAALLALAGYVLATHPPPELLATIAALSIYQLTAALVATLFIPAMAAQRMLWPALSELGARAIAFGVTGTLILVAHVPLHRALIGYPLAALVWLALALKARARFAPGLRLVLNLATTREILSVLWSFALLEIAAQLFARIGVIVLTLRASEAAAGIFATGLRLIEVALMPLSFLGVASYPRLSQLFASDAAAFRRSALDLLWWMLLGGGLVAWGLYYVAPALLVPVLGARFAGAEPVIQSMAVFALLQAVEVAFGRVMLSADRQTVNAVYVAAGALASVALNLALVPLYGVGGAVVAGSIAFALIDALCLISLRSPLGTAALRRLLVALALNVALASALAALIASHGLRPVVPALVFLAVFTVGGLLGYRTRHPDAPPPPAGASA